MAEKERSVRVRALTGESGSVPVTGDCTVLEFKGLLRKAFPVAGRYPNFNLYHKGVKLNLQSLISCYSIGPDDVIGLIPVIKKRAEDRVSDQSACLDTNVGPSSGFADSAWSNIMQEMREISSNRETTWKEPGSASSDVGLEGTRERVPRSSSSTKRRRSDNFEKMGFPDDLVLSILEDPGEDFLEEDGNNEKLLEFLQLESCLKDPSTDRCLSASFALSQKAGKEVQDENVTMCMCPTWLCNLMKMFSVLNMYAAYLQLRRKELTLNSLNQLLFLLEKLGIQVGMQDIENLALLLPKVIAFIGNETARRNTNNAIIIVKPLVENEQAPNSFSKARRLKATLKHLDLIERRERSFRHALASVMSIVGTKIAELASLGDLVLTTSKGVQSSASNGMRKCSFSANGENKNEGSSRSVSTAKLGRRLCHDVEPLSPVEIVEHLRYGIGSQRQIVHIQEIAGRKPIYLDIPNMVSKDTRQLLERIGITKLYSHQTESIQLSLLRKNVIVATLTSSGKSLCYNVPVLEELFKDPFSCALYLFPTKALSQDQLKALKHMTEGFDISSQISIYDGDTLQGDRTWMRDNARLLITNPDMLHKSILPYHGQFERILSNLRFVVIDEAHAYKGAFGCHTALILRRLRRLCTHVYGSDPAFIFSTATSANPSQHCMELANLESIELVQNDGSPSAKKLFVLWNSSESPQTHENWSSGHAYKPPYKGSSPIWEVSCLFAEMVQHGLRCIAFCPSRRLCELVLSYTRDILRETAPGLVDSITSYRAGYAPEVRRATERDLFAGKLCGLAATNALELGIDVGHLDVTLHLGFPGSIASLWQQAGRSGRREQPSLAVFVAFGGPLDQYFMKHPDKLFGSPIECCSVDAQNPQALEQHLACAAAEHPLSVQYDEKFFGSGLEKAITSLRKKGCLSCDISRDPSARTWDYIGPEKKPSNIVNIRAIENVTYAVIDCKNNEVLEKIEESKAFFQVHEGAVYMQQGKTYLVKDMDLSAKIAWCQEVDLKYYTKTRDYTDIKVTSGDIAYALRMPQIPNTNEEPTTTHLTTAIASHCQLITTWFGFRRISRGSNKVLDTVELSLPQYSYESQAVWIQVPQAVKEAVESRNFSFRAGMHAASHAVLNVVPLCIICNYSDLAPECSNPFDSRSFLARILLYDRHPGGTGVSYQVRPHFTDLLVLALEIISSCSCIGDTGCPKCVQCLSCHEYNEDLHKEAAIMIILGVLDAEKSHFKDSSCRC
ncbi:hypothetical protein MLD38_021798 [Melastoma candidum]|uniref:Uncharacterized protein n=1 Tax=Melastoma candidum TaxID=119954 RepID=A0ACB9QH20_9MYRT|nr:hypothetical protein MLD38_021798 [Melastoma candidum]